MLLDTVRSIAAQEVDGRIEVLIMSKSDGAAYESLRHELSELLQNGVIDMFTIPPDRTISYGRNTGAARAAGRYLAFIDADVKLAANWVSEMIGVLNTNQEAILCGAVQQADQDQTDIDVIKSSMSQANAGVVNALPGNALFIEKSVFNAHPGFPEHLETCEDWVFTNTLSMHGDVVLSDNSHFVHLGEDKSYATLFRKEIWRGTSNLGSISGRKIEPAEWPSFGVPMVVGGSLSLAALFFLMGRLGLSGGLVLFSLLAPFLYTLRLKRKTNVPVGMVKLVRFYLVYFSARAVGMIKGLLSGETLKESSR
jgi:hypothetical protein